MEHSEVTVLRYGHRPGRDDRMTTHVGLTARALGADHVVFPDNAGTAAATVQEVTDRFGGPFSVELRADQRAMAQNWDGTVVHLTMYGQPIQSVEEELHTQASDSESILVIVGGEKVPSEIYETADYNISITNQPHSEVAGLAVFLDRLFEGVELDRDWDGATRKVIPKPAGKQVIDPQQSDADEKSDRPTNADPDD